MPSPAGQKTKCEITFTRKNGKQVINIKAVPELEAFFTAPEPKVSDKYLKPNGEGLSFYPMTDKLKSVAENYNQKTRYTVDGQKPVELRDYGATLFTEEGQLNASFLRTVGISSTGGADLVVDRLILDEQVKDWIAQISAFIKHVYGAYIDETVIKATIHLRF